MKKLLLTTIFLSTLIGANYAYAFSPQYGINNGLAGYWSFNARHTPWSSGTTGTTIDMSGNGNTGTMTNMAKTTSYVSGKIGEALSFDGSNDVVAVSDNNSLDLGPVTIAFWVYLRSHTRNFNDLIIKYTGTANYNVYVSLAGTLCVLVSSGTCSTFDFDTSSMNKWIHVTTVMTSTTNTDLYINGQYHSSIAKGYGSANTAVLYIGGFTNEWTNTSMDDVRIYNRSLSASEVNQIYRLGLTGNYR